jgi:hypothetical protein
MSYNRYQIDEIDYCFHLHTTDGIASAWIARSFNEHIEYPESDDIDARGVVGRSDINAFHGKSILFVDVEPKHIDRLKKIAKHIIIISHEKGDTDDKDNEDDNIELIRRSSKTQTACQVVWKRFFPKKEVPWFLQYISDRELWQNKLSYSKEINTALYENRHIRSIDGIDALSRIPSSELHSFKDSLIKKGKFLIDVRSLTIQSIIRTQAITCHLTIGNKTYRVWLYHCARSLLSDAGNKLTRWQFKDGSYPDFVVWWHYDIPLHRYSLSFRSLAGSEKSIRVDDIVSSLSSLHDLSSDGKKGYHHAASCTMDGSVVLRDLFVPFPNMNDENDENNEE